MFQYYKKCTRKGLYLLSLFVVPETYSRYTQTGLWKL